MFEGDYTIYGKHATYMKYLKEAKVFNRYIDVYMAGAVLGALYEKRAKQTDSSDRARIYADAFDTEHVRCNEIFKTVILSDTSKPWSAEERANICFRYRDPGCLRAPFSLIFLSHIKLPRTWSSFQRRHARGYR